jgi:prepilin-type N-terminal cleavage/methylation domain-containing protein
MACPLPLYVIGIVHLADRGRNLLLIAARIRERKRQQGFTLIELMLVIVIIGVLAGITLPNYFRLVRNAKVGRTASEMRSLSKGFVAYYVSYGQFPPDSHLTLPTGMDQYINPSIWANETPIGGHYNWEGPDSYPYAGLSIYPAADVPLAERQRLDQILDDGDLSQGKFRNGTNGRPTLIIDE